MAADRTFFKALATIDPRTHVPVVAIATQGAASILIALTGKYDLILNWVTSIDYVFFGFAALALIIFRRRDRAAGAPEPWFKIPLHPWSTLAFLVVAWAIVLDVLVKSTTDTRDRHRRADHRNPGLVRLQSNETARPLTTRRKTPAPVSGSVSLWDT